MMASGEKQQPATVAVIGGGLAGLSVGQRIG